jgi:hypothetical protein
MPAGIAQIVRALQLATVRAFLKRLDGQGVMRAAHAPAGGRSLSLGNGHLGTFYSDQQLGFRPRYAQPMIRASRTPGAPHTRPAGRQVAKRGWAYSDFRHGCKRAAVVEGSVAIENRSRGTLSMTMILPVALTTAAACALINFWLAARILRIRMGQRIAHGDGGDARLAARMRAHANFAEYTPIVLILVALIELAAGTNLWLWLAGGVYVVARILHPIGMDGWMPARQAGTAATFTTMILLAVAALAVPWLTPVAAETVEIASR